MLSDKKHSIVNLSLGITRTDHPSIEIETRAEAFYTSAVLKKLFVKLDVKRSTQDRHGAGEARGAHNSEDIGSKPIAGIIHHFASNVQDMKRTKHHTIQ